ncbi:thioesterase II family protein [Massilia sp. TSP1-1-2]|uniref:thioesterase II family protein n=1 Tax=unclassified Massilia TaxID=2609279 RepID=UPI003CF44317
MQPTSRWLISRPHPFCQPRLRLYCFAYAGGSAAVFQPWQALLPPDVEVCAIQLPGRGIRFSETPCTSMPALLDQLSAAMAGQPPLPCVFFGHSLGGLIAFELARHRMARALPLPLRVIVSGAEAPRHRAPPKNLHAMPDAQLIAALREYKGTPEEVLDNRELMALLAPSIRADFALVEQYVYQDGKPLSMPLTVFAGKRDDHIVPENVQYWQKETSAAFRVQWFEGDHFFINSEREAVLACVKAELEDLAELAEMAEL